LKINDCVLVRGRKAFVLASYFGRLLYKLAKSLLKP